MFYQKTVDTLVFSFSLNWKRRAALFENMRLKSFNYRKGGDHSGLIMTRSSAVCCGIRYLLPSVMKILKFSGED